MSVSGASFSMKSSIFSEISKMITTTISSEMAKKKVPRNFLIIYISIFFKLWYCFYNIMFQTSTIEIYL